VGSAAQTKAMKKVSGKIKLELAQFRELEAFMQFAQDLDPDTKKRIDRGQRMMATLRQKNGAPLPFERQAVVIYAAVNGYLEKVPVAKVPEFEEKFLNFLDSSAPAVLESIAKARDIVAQTEGELKEQLKKFEETHPNLFRGETLTSGLSKVSP
jgi:F0F1-type ATP synthase alpha subunit